MQRRGFWTILTVLFFFMKVTFTWLIIFYIQKFLLSFVILLLNSPWIVSTKSLNRSAKPLLVLTTANFSSSFICEQYDGGRGQVKNSKPRKSLKSSEIFESVFSILTVGQNQKLGNKKTRNNISKISEISEDSEFSVCHFFIHFFFFILFQFIQFFSILHL